MRPLKICLWAIGLLYSLAVLGLFMRFSAIGSIATAFGSPAFPVSPLFDYVVRVMFGACFAIGVYHVILALSPMKYGVLVPFTGLASILVGAICLTWGVKVRLPALVYIGDFFFCELFGALIVVFWLRARAAEPPAQPEQLEPDE